MRVKYFGLCLLLFFIGDTSYSLHLGHMRVFLLFPSGDGFVPERTNSTNLGSRFPERGTVAGLVPFLSLCAQLFQTMKEICVKIRQSQICVFLRCGCLHHTSQGSDCRSQITVKHQLVLKEQ